MKTHFFSLLLTASVSLSAIAATNDLSNLLQKALFEEEGNRNLSAAIDGYQALLEYFDRNRALAATAVYRLGECYRKQGNTNAAVAQYQRLIRDFSDQDTLVTLSQQNLAALGAIGVVTASGPFSNAASVMQQKTPGMDWVRMGGAEALLPDPSGSSPAAQESDEVRRIRELIRNSPDLINAVQRNGLTLLDSAAARGDLSIAELLLQNGAAVNGLRQPSLTPLHYAAGNGHKAIVDLLITNGAKVDSVTESGVMPLHLAAGKGFTEVAQTLVQAKAPVDAKAVKAVDRTTEELSYTIQQGQAPLHLAASAGLARMLEVLIAAGAQVNVLDAAGRTPLSYAAAAASLPAVEVLLNAKADPNAGSADIPLLASVHADAIPIIEKLVATGADPSKPARTSFIANPGSPVSPLGLAVRKGSKEAVNVLIKSGAELNTTTPEGWPLLNAAINQNDLATLETLLTAGAHPNETIDPIQPLLLAVRDKKAAAVELLLQYHADPSVTTKDVGWSALHLATMVVDTNLVQLLLNAGANVAAVDHQRRTPLHLAAQQGLDAIAALLLKHNADPNALDAVGLTPLDLALGRGPASSSGFPGSAMRAPYGPGGARPAGGVPVPAPMRAGGGSVQISPAPDKVASLLRAHGAQDDIPRMDQIQLRRPSNGWASPVIFRDPEGKNQFTLLEILAFHYELLAKDKSEPRRIGLQSSSIALQFPDFSRLRLRLPYMEIGKWQEKVVDLRALFDAAECPSPDPLPWGSVVEVPEEDHPINLVWEGLSQKQLESFKKCLARVVHISVKGKSTELKLEPEMIFSPAGPLQVHTGISFWLTRVLQRSNLVLASSDLSRVKVTRRDSQSGTVSEWIFDCTPESKGPDLWLKDGDHIEVPDRP